MNDSAVDFSASINTDPLHDAVEIITSSPDFGELVKLLRRLGREAMECKGLDDSDLAAMCGDRGVLDWTPIHELIDVSRSVPSG